MEKMDIRLVLFAICLALINLFGAPVQGARAGARGGSRGGSYSSRYSGGSYSGYTSRYSGSTSRYSGGSYSSYSGSRLYSSYARSPVSARYGRIYSGYRGYYYYYYSMYFYYSPAYAYYRRSNFDSSSQGVCVNYEASENGTVMGTFTCPLPFEPNDFSACCGEEYAEYCCQPTTESFNYLPIILVMTAAVIGITAFIGLRAYRYQQRNRRNVGPQQMVPPRRGPGGPRPAPGNRPPPSQPHPYPATVTRAPPPNQNMAYRRGPAGHTTAYPPPGPQPYSVTGPQQPAYPPPYPTPAFQGDHSMPQPMPPVAEPMPQGGPVGGPIPPPSYDDAVRQRGEEDKPPQYEESRDRY